MGIGQEISVFVSACCSGVLVCTVYGVLRIIRRLIRHSLFWVSIEDLTYWVWCGIYIFSEIHRTCSGQIRWYYVIGVLLGGGISGTVIFKFMKNKIDKSNKKE